MKLTKYELDALAEKIADVQEEKHKELLESFNLNSEYVDFCEDPKSELISTLKNLINKFKEIDKVEKEHRKIIENLHEEILKKSNGLITSDVSNYYRLGRLENALNSAKRDAIRELFKVPTFNRQTLINTLKADIVMSDFKTPKEFYDNATI